MSGTAHRTTAGRRLALGLAAAVAATGLAGCTGRTAGPEVPATALATGLSALDVARVPLTGTDPAEAARRLTEATAGMGGRRPAVHVQDVHTHGDTASATLAVVWDLDGSDQDWAYTSTAQLTRVGDDWRVAWSPALLEPHLAAGDRLALRRVQPDRAEVLGADGAVLVTGRPVVRVGIDRTRVDAPRAGASAEALARVLEIDRDAYAARVRSAGPRAFVEALVVRAGDLDRSKRRRIAAVAGAVQLPDELPLAPTRDFARPLLGSVGPATAEVVEASRGQVQPGDEVGLSGLQQRYDVQLRGTPGVVVDRVLAGGGGGRHELFRRAPEPGRPLRTTLDPDLQARAEGVLTDVEPASAVVALQPSTGHVLAAASGSGGEGWSTATLGRYAPGSTFKVVSALALLRSGLTPDSRLPCTPTVTVAGKEFRNYRDYPASGLGEQPLRSVLAHSCNTALVGAGARVDQPALRDAAAALGLGVERDLGAPAFLGTVPAEAAETEHAASMIGQGRVEASPLGMAAVAASVAAGRPVVPRLLDEAPPATEQPRGVRPEEAGDLRAMLRAVVTEGSGRALRDVPGPAVAAKTGTAEYGEDRPPRTHAWMIAVQGDLAVAVFVQDGASGARTAGPLLERFLQAAR
ncbi:MAG: penicillin-binding transpeptidase domain-containing protein [Actinomycetota bacterium]|nr:penicillin-binding transpeptidase domain-containing protein [Actinomycetota bacterium]